MNIVINKTVYASELSQYGVTIGANNEIVGPVKIYIKKPFFIDQDLHIPSDVEIIMESQSIVVGLSHTGFVNANVTVNGHIHGCNQLWGGFKVTSTGHLSFDGATIEDAVNGVSKVPNALGGTFSTQNTIFKNCWTGLDITVWSTTSSVDNCTFEGGFLKPVIDYVIGTPIGQYSNTGIFIAEGIPSLTITNSHFKNLDQGIKGSCTPSLEISNCDFTNIQSRNCEPYSGNAINLLDFCAANKTNGSISTNTFEECGTAIFTYNTGDMSISQNRVQSSLSGSRGIDMNWGAGKTTIEANTISVASSGLAGSPCSVDVLQTSATPSAGISVKNRRVGDDSRIFDNHISLNGNGTGTGINVSNITGLIPIWHNQEIILNSSGTGISIQRSFLVNSLQNRVILNARNSKGMEITGNFFFAQHVNNTVIGNKKPNQKGMYHFNSPNSFVCSNTMENLTVGLEYNGLCESSESVKVNRFTSCSTGLRLTPVQLSSIGIQTLTGNLWTDKTNIVAANDESSSKKTTFFYNKLQDPDHEPKPIFYPIDLFKDKNGFTAKDCGFERPTENEIDREIVEGRYPEEEEAYRTEARWFGENYLYAKLMQNPELAESAEMNAFLKNTKESNVGKFYDVQQFIASGAVEEAIELNRTIAPNSLIEENEQTINAIYLNLLLEGISPSIRNVEVKVLTSIANQCPVLGGNAVFLARNLYEYIDSSVSYDDEALCTNTSSPRQQYQNSNTTLSLSPNPAHDKVQINYALTEEAQSLGAFLVVTDLTGRTVLKQPIENSSNSSQWLSVEQLQSNLYLCQLQTSNGKILVTKKLTIVH